MHTMKKKQVIIFTSDKLVQLGNLGRDSQINALVTNFDKDTTEDIGLNLVGNQQLLAFSKLALLQRVSDLVQGRLVKFLYNYYIITCQLYNSPYVFSSPNFFSQINKNDAFLIQFNPPHPLPILLLYHHTQYLYIHTLAEVIVKDNSLR